VASSDALPQVPANALRPSSSSFRRYSPAHHHAGSVSAPCFRARFAHQLQGQLPMIYRFGESFAEPPGIDTYSPKTRAPPSMRTFAVFVADEGATLTTYH
jgi:hypothetical protein